MLCRFEDRRSGQALELMGPRQRITACSAGELEAAFAQIEAAQAAGRWVALLLNYELGEWLEPALLTEDTQGNAEMSPRLTALVFDDARSEPVWGPPGPLEPVGLHARPLIDKARYLHHIQALRHHIAQGDLYQANYSFPIAIDSPYSPRQLYRHIAARHPAAHGAYIEDGPRTVLSFSPELFVARHGDLLTVRPMKGTAPRHTDPQEDQASGQALLHSEKNRAENVMIVDLLRNDLGRLAVPGSVNVETLFTLEQYPSVWTLTSTITARAPNVGLQSLLRALFPCGSITGAPKIAAMRKIKQLEARTRGIYCGSVGWLAPGGDCSLNVAIRTIEMHGPHHGIFGVGGGIVHDSEAELEWQECLWKAGILGALDTQAAKAGIMNR